MVNKLKKYSIIYADPPWCYDASDFLAEKSLITKNRNTQYATMDFEDLKALPVQNIAEKDCLLFMRTTSAFVYGAIEVGMTWGFKFSVVGFVWDKQAINPGNYTLSNCEFVLIFKKGKIPTPRGLRNVRAMISEKRKKHSAKPAEVRNRIVQMFPSSSRIELFAREKVKGWDSWGNEIISDIVL